MSPIKRKVDFYVDEPCPKMVLARLLQNRKVYPLNVQEVKVHKVLRIYEQYNLGEETNVEQKKQGK